MAKGLRKNLVTTKKTDADGNVTYHTVMILTPK